MLVISISSIPGGEDPGVSLTRKIFTISGGDNPPEAIIEHHDGCQYSHGFSLFYNTKSYQDKLYINVKTSGMVRLLILLSLFSIFTFTSVNSKFITYIHYSVYSEIHTLHG